MIRVEAGKWVNLDELDASDLLEELVTEARITTKEALIMLQNEVKETLTGQRTGRTYRVGARGVGSGTRTHVASAPGEPPAVLFDNLRGSVGHEGPRRRGMVFEGEAGPGLGQDVKTGEKDPSKTYARRLELGGVDSRGIRILPRPYMEPSAKRAKPKIERLFARRLGSQR